MTPGHLIKVGLASLALLAVPAGIDTRALIVDGTGAAMGTVGNPVITSGTGSAGSVTQGTTPWVVAGGVAPGAAVSQNPLLMAGQFGGNIKLLGLDTNGSPTVNQGAVGAGGAAAWPTQGAVGTGTAVTGNPFSIGGRDAAGAVRFIGGDTSGIFAQGPAAAGAAVAGNPVLVGGSDGTNAQPFKVDTSGRATVVGAAAAAAAVAGNPLLLGARDAAGNAQFVGGDNNGAFAQGPKASATALGGNPVLIGASSGSNVFNLRINAGPNDNASNGAEQLVTEGNQYDYNGAGWDRHRNSQDVILHASAVTGTGTVNTDVTTYNYAYLIIHANVTLYNAGNVLFKVQMQDANGIFADLPLATTGAVSTGADIFLTVGPTAWPANASPVFYANQVLPRTIRIVQTVAAASVTFSAAYSLKN